MQPGGTDKKSKETGGLQKHSRGKPLLTSTQNEGAARTEQPPSQQRTDPAKLNLNLDLPERNSDIGPNESCMKLTELEVQEELVKQVQAAKEALQKKQAECNKNFTKAETVSLMTKYQMIFVKIELYLMNFYHIYHHYHYPLLKAAFSRIRLQAHRNKVAAATTALAVVGKLKRGLSSLHFIEKRKVSASLAGAFGKIRDNRVNAKLLNEIRIAKTIKIKKMKEQLLEKKEETEQLNGQVEELRGRLKARPESPDAKNKDADSKSFELKKWQAKIAKEEERNKKLKLSLRATEDKILSFISELNTMLDSHEDFFAGNKQFNQIWADFLSHKNFLN